METKNLTKCALVAALTFIFTYTFKINVNNGYVHLGDCFIFVGVLVLGRKKGALAGAIGAALADIIGGYIMWAGPTFFIKLIMAYVMGTVVEVFMKDVKFNYVLGAAIGGMVQIVLYTTINALVYGGAYAIVSCAADTVQSAVGVAAASVVITLLKKTKTLDYIKKEP